MTCPLCGRRTAKRRCPALGKTICSVCCGTKRQREIPCTPDCHYLTSAREHPPAVVQRQHERDVALLVPAVAGLTERQSRLFFLFQSITVRLPQDPLRPLLDEDVAEAAASAAAALETASRGLIYERPPASLPAQELAAAFRQAFEELAGQLNGPRSPLERDGGVALRALEEAARRVGPLVGDERQGFQQLIRRLLPPPSAPATDVEGRGSGLVLP